MEQDDQVARAAVQDAVELRPVMTPQLTKLTSDLRTVGKRKMRTRRREHVHAIDLVVDDHLLADGESLDEVVDGLRSIGSSIEDSSKWHETQGRGTVGSARCVHGPIG